MAAAWDIRSRRIPNVLTLPLLALGLLTALAIVWLNGATQKEGIAGFAAATAAEIGLGFVPGVEVSVTWEGATVHIVGLGVDPDDPLKMLG